MEAERKGAAFAGRALHVYPAVVHPDVFVHQMEADARPRPAVFGIEAVEQIRDVFRLDAGAVILDDNRHPRFGDGKLHRDAPSFRRELEGVGEQVDNHLLDHIGVEPDTAFFRIGGKEIVDVAYLRHAVEIGFHFAGEGDDLRLAYLQFLLLVLDLAEVEYLVDHPEQATGILMDQLEVRQVGRVVEQADQLVQRSQDQGERRTYLVGDVREELELGGGHLFYLGIEGDQLAALFLLFLVYLTQFAVGEPYLPVDIKDVDRQGDKADHQQRNHPDGAPEEEETVQQLVHTGALRLDTLLVIQQPFGLQQEATGGFLVDDAAMQGDKGVDRFAVDQSHGGTYNLFASGRIEERGVDASVGDGLQTGFGYGVHTDNRQAFPLGGVCREEILAGGDRHDIVMGKHKVDGLGKFHLPETSGGYILFPFAFHRDESQVLALREGIPETVVTLLCGGRAFRTPYFEDCGIWRQVAGGIFPGGHP